MREHIPYGIERIRENRRLIRAARTYGFPADFPLRPSGKALYIIGTGPSVLDFDFSQIKSEGAVSLVLNDGIFLDYKYDYHSFELNRHVGWRAYENERLVELYDKSDMKTLCRIPKITSELEDYHSALYKNPSRVSLFTSVTAFSRANFPRQLSNYFSHRIHSNAPGIDPGFSLGRLLIRLIKLGFNDLRLVGVDLFSADHFWHHSSDFTWMLNLRNKNGWVPKFADGPHKIARDFRLVNAINLLEYLEGVSSEYGFSLRTQKESAIAKIIPYF